MKPTCTCQDVSEWLWMEKGVAWADCDKWSWNTDKGSGPMTFGTKKGTFILNNTKYSNKKIFHMLIVAFLNSAIFIQSIQSRFNFNSPKTTKMWYHSHALGFAFFALQVLSTENSAAAAIWLKWMECCSWSSKGLKSAFYIFNICVSSNDFTPFSLLYLFMSL